LLVLRRAGFGVTAAGGLLEAVAVAVHRRDLVGPPVQQRACEPFRGQNDDSLARSHCSSLRYLGNWQRLVPLQETQKTAKIGLTMWKLFNAD
jgi:hypothetical protein